MTEGTNNPQRTTPSPARARYRYSQGPAVAMATASAYAAPGRSGGELTSRELLWWVMGGVIFAAAFYWLFQISVGQLVSVWARDASWSHGFAVPLLSAALVYLQRDKLAGMKVAGSWAGVVILIYAVVSEIVFRVTGQFHLANTTIVVALYGAALFIFGWEYLRVLWLPIAFLMFMIPPPTALYVKLTGPMQDLAALAGTMLLPLFGIESFKAGTTLSVRMANGKFDTLNVAEACSGIRMLVAFVALAVVLAYSTPRPMWQKFFLACCAAPVAIFCNALRVTLTGVLNVYAGAKFAQGTSHQMLGFLMLIPAGAIQLGIAWVLDRIYIEDAEDADVSSGGVAIAAAGGER